MSCINNQPQTFIFNQDQVRIVDRDGEPWFVLKDVCSILEIINHNEVATRLRDSQKDGVDLTDSMGRRQNITVINESGLYSVIMRSHKPDAERFQIWVTDEVLPSIRKTGSYGTTAIDLRDPAQLTQIAAQLVDLVNEEKAKNLQLTTELAEATPKAAALDIISSADGSLCITDAAKALQMRPSDLFKYLTTEGWIYKRAGNSHQLGYSTHVRKGWLTHKVTTIQRVDGTEKIVEQVRITSSGLTQLALQGAA